MTHTPALPGPLPDGSILVHIGMHKTGTTAIQSLLAEHRDQLADRGIVYPGRNGAHHVEARSLIQLAIGAGGADPAPPPRRWVSCATDLTRESRRAVLSSEFFSRAGDQDAARLVAELGSDRVHIVVGIRNITATSVSTWQQTLKQGRVSTIDRWAAANIPRDGRPPADPQHWQQSDVLTVARRWAGAAGPQGVTVVVVDGEHRERLSSTFEQLLGLEPGFLIGKQPARSNRGMTAAEAEFVRRVNVAVRGTLDWATYRRMVRGGIVQTMVEARTPAPGEPRPVLPAWAQESARLAGVRAAAEIRALGVRVVGDLDSLAAPVDTGAAGVARPDEVPIEPAVQAVTGALFAELEIEATRGPRIADVRTQDLARVVAGRITHRAMRTPLLAQWERRRSGSPGRDHLSARPDG